MARNQAGRYAISSVTLRPDVRFSGARLPTPEDLEHLHQAAHEECYIANSVKTEVRVEPATPRIA
jgi:organic hydroperoxide reductase OsmC/OhrA